MNAIAVIEEMRGRSKKFAEICGWRIGFWRNALLPDADGQRGLVSSKNDDAGDLEKPPESNETIRLNGIVC